MIVSWSQFFASFELDRLRLEVDCPSSKARVYCTLVQDGIRFVASLEEYVERSRQGQSRGHFDDCREC